MTISPHYDLCIANHEFILSTCKLYACLGGELSISVSQLAALGQAAAAREQVVLQEDMEYVPKPRGALKPGDCPKSTNVWVLLTLLPRRTYPRVGILDLPNQGNVSTPVLVRNRHSAHSTQHRASCSASIDTRQYVIKVRPANAKEDGPVT